LLFDDVAIVKFEIIFATLLVFLAFESLSFRVLCDDNFVGDVSADDGEARKFVAIFLIEFRLEDTMVSETIEPAAVTPPLPTPMLA
jgi:hypothetical protein